MSKHKILFINATSEIGGGDIILLDLVKGLDRERFIPLVVLPFEGPLVGEFRKLGVEVRFVKMSVIKRSYNPLYLISYFLNFVPTVLRIKSLIGKEGVSLVHTNSSVVLGGALAAKLSGVPHVWHVREIIIHPRMVSRALVEIIGRLTDRAITMTEAIKNTFPERYRKGNKLKTIYDGIDLSVFTAKAESGLFRKEYGIKPHVPLIGMIGRMVPWKGHRDFVQAAAKVRESCPEVYFVIVGDIVRGEHESYRKELKDTVRELGMNGRVIFAGMRRDIPNILAALDCLILPSSSPEPSGRVILEAMALSKPVIATDHGGPRELIVPDVTGILVPSSNPRAMAIAIISLLQNEGVASKMGCEGRKRVEQLFSLSRHIRQVETVYDSLLKPHGREDDKKSGEGRA